MREGRIGLELGISNECMFKYRDYVPVLEFLVEDRN